MSHLRSTHQKQLEEISSQLFRFEASLRAKEKQLEESMILKEQVRHDFSLKLYSKGRILFQIKKCPGMEL
jgi:hypothetical protein